MSIKSPTHWYPFGGDRYRDKDSPFTGDKYVTSLEHFLWERCTKNNVTWADIQKISKLLCKGANPFIRDTEGNYLRNIVLCGYWFNKNHENSIETIKIEIKEMNVMYQTKIVEMLDERMYILANNWNEHVKFETQDFECNNGEGTIAIKSVEVNKLMNVHFVPLLREVAFQFCLVNKRLSQGTFAYGLFPREVSVLILKYVASNIVANLTSQECIKKTLQMFTIPNILNVGKNALKITERHGCYEIEENGENGENDASTKLKKLQRKRKVEIVDSVSSYWLSSYDKSKKAKQICQNIPDVVGIITATSEKETASAKIMNPQLKPFTVVGRVFSEQSRFVRDSVDLDVSKFVNNRKISRNHAHVRYNPFTHKIEIKIVGINIMALNGHMIHFNRWHQMESSDILSCPMTDITFSVTYLV